jgi:hypothetical protein
MIQGEGGHQGLKIQKWFQKFVKVHSKCCHKSTHSATMVKHFMANGSMVISQPPYSSALTGNGF